MSAQLLHGFAPFKALGQLNLQIASRRGGARRCGSADHLVGLEEERRGDGEAERLGRLQVDDQLQRGGLLHGQIRGMTEPAVIDRLV
jgi:hypothetical protein